MDIRLWTVLQKHCPPRKHRLLGQQAGGVVVLLGWAEPAIGASL